MCKLLPVLVAAGMQINWSLMNCEPSMKH